MKNFKNFICLLLIMCFLLPVNVQAQERVVTDSYVEILDNGDRIITTITEDVLAFSPLATTKSKTGSKTSSYTSGGTVLWSVTVKGTFTYNGSSVSCTTASASTTINNSAWKTGSISASKSGATATGKATMDRYVAGLKRESIEKSVKLTCSKSGTLS